MPNLDGTGPLGNGPNGRGRGPCQGGAFRSYGRGRRGGYGFRNTPVAVATDEEAIRMEVQALEARLNVLKGRLKEEVDSP